MMPEEAVDLVAQAVWLRWASGVLRERGGLDHVADQLDESRMVLERIGTAEYRKHLK